MVCLVVSRLRGLVRASRARRAAQKAETQAQEERVVADRKLRQLTELQNRITAVDPNIEVWGPADPDCEKVRKYRRYWMEQPPQFPMRSRERRDPELIQEDGKPAAKR